MNYYSTYLFPSYQRFFALRWMVTVYMAHDVTDVFGSKGRHEFMVASARFGTGSACSSFGR